MYLPPMVYFNTNRLLSFIYYFFQYCFINGRRTKDDASNINLVVKIILEHARKKDRSVNEDELKSNMTLFMSCLDVPSDAEFNTRLSGLPDDFLNKCMPFANFIFIYD
jgi:hypothetical protein